MSERHLEGRPGTDRRPGAEPAPPQPARAIPALVPTPASIMALQRSAGNAAVAGWLDESFRGQGADRENEERSEGVEADAATARALSESFRGEGPDKNPKEGAPGGEGGETAVAATITPGGVTHEAPAGEPGDSSGKVAKDEVKPAGSTSYDGAAASSTCLPADILPADVDWDVKDKGTDWGVEVTAFRTTGKIKVNPTPSKPSEMVTPNTANPVDGGNIENKAGSNNHWKFAVDQMRAYNKPSGGRSRHWHSTAASDAHEFEHWKTDWMKNVLGGLWPQANKDIDAITIPKADAADDKAAKPKLKPKVDARIKTANSKSTTDWNAVPDDPGLAGANGYIAGQKVLDGLIDAVESYAKTKKW